MLAGCESDMSHGLTEELDIAISRKQEFSQEKERRIASLKSLFDIADITPEQEYDLNQKLYEEYRKYRLDSAMRYVERNIEIAKLLGSLEKSYRSQIQLAPLYSFSGMYIESRVILKSIKASQLPEELRGKYYEACIQFYDHYGTASYQNKYDSRKEALRDSLLAVVDPESRTWKSNYVSTLLATGDPTKLDEAEEVLLNLLDQTPRDTPDYASSAHQLARVYGRKNEPAKEKEYYTISAITDIKCATKEHSALQNLALIYFDDGDAKRAFTYTQEAIEDAIFSGAQFRAIQISKFYSLINSSYRDKEAASKVKLQRYLILVSVLTLSLVLLLLFVYGQIKKWCCIKKYSVLK
jgi:tetratricopeptide (TPR) repeat protein